VLPRSLTDVYPLLTILVVCAALIVVYPPAALAIFLLGAIVTGWAALRKARTRATRRAVEEGGRKSDSDQAS
jgi:threonine/homoserine/homoserine lactone efflux protein